MKLTLPSGVKYAYGDKGEKICTGSQMGRQNEVPENLDASPKLRLERLQWVDGDYDQGGAYWGYNGCTAVYCAWGEWGIPSKPVRIFVRALTREDAKVEVKEILRNVTFYR